jgi:hypothetical protein
MKDLVKEALDDQRKEMQKNGTMPAANGTIPTTKGTIPAKLTAIKVDLAGEPSNLPEALLVGDVGLFNKGEIATIVAQPGSGKSNVCEAIIAAYAAAKGYTPLDTLNFVYSPEHTSEGKKALWVDTERTTNDTLKSVRRLRNRCGTTPAELDTCLDFYRFRKLNPNESLTELKILVASGNYDLVILDGIFGFSPDINNLERAGVIMKELEILAETYDVAILCTIHPNKNSDTISGNLGSTLYKFCRAVLYIEKLKNEVRRLTSEIGQHKLSHAGGVINTPFAWNTELGFFTVCDAPDTTTATVLYDWDKVKKVFGNTTEMASTDFKTQYGLLVGISQSTVNKHVPKLIADKKIDTINKSKATRYKLINDDEDLPF